MPAKAGIRETQSRRGGRLPLSRGVTVLETFYETIRLGNETE